MTLLPPKRFSSGLPGGLLPIWTAWQSSCGICPASVCFVGMLTDSRSFLSYPRHEYFRRSLCRVIGGWVADGQAPADYELLGAMVQDICYNNVEKFIGIQG